MRHLLPLPLACAAALASACGGGEDAGSRPQNVILIVADTLRADRLGCYGYPRPTSPAIDALAARGVVYEDCHAQSCWTLPSMISMMSSLPVTKEQTGLPETPLLAEVLQRHGFTTAAFVTNPTVSIDRDSSLDRGFDRGFDYFARIHGLRAPEVADAFGEWYEGWRAGREARSSDPGFFAWVHFMDPHAPYKPPEPFDVFDGPRPDRDLLLPRWEEARERVYAMGGTVDPLAFELAVSRMEAVSNRYDGEVLTVDAGVGRIVELLRQSGELERTLIIFCSDHGEMLYEQESYPHVIQLQFEKDGGLPEGVMNLFGVGHLPWYYQQVWRTPLIMAGPGLPAGVRRGGLAANLDIYPTVLEALDLPAPEGLTGHSLWGGAEPRHERVFAYGHRTTAVLDVDGNKLVVPWSRLMLLPDEAEDPGLLFDLAEDPHEGREISSERPDLLRELRLHINGWRAANDREVIDGLTADQIRVLEQMGYIGAGAIEDPKLIER